MDRGYPPTIFVMKKTISHHVDHANSLSRLWSHTTVCFPSEKKMQCDGVLGILLHNAYANRIQILYQMLGSSTTKAGCAPSPKDPIDMRVVALQYVLREVMIGGLVSKNSVA